MLTYKAAYQFIEEGVHAHVIDFPGAITCGADLDEARRLLASALLDLAGYALELGEALPAARPIGERPGSRRGRAHPSASARVQGLRWFPSEWSCHEPTRPDPASAQARVRAGAGGFGSLHLAEPGERASDGCPSASRDSESNRSGDLPSTRHSRSVKPSEPGGSRCKYLEEVDIWFRCRTKLLREQELTTRNAQPAAPALADRP